jgi:hypothetical protein
MRRLPFAPGHLVTSLWPTCEKGVNRGRRPRALRDEGARSTPGLRSMAPVRPADVRGAARVRVLAGPRLHPVVRGGHRPAADRAGLDDRGAPAELKKSLLNTADQPVVSQSGLRPSARHQRICSIHHRYQPVRPGTRCCFGPVNLGSYFGARAASTVSVAGSGSGPAASASTSPSAPGVTASASKRYPTPKCVWM